MRCCWGVDSVLPADLIPRLPRGMTYGYHDTTDADIVFVPGIDVLRSILSTVNKRDVAVIVFDARVRLHDWGIPLLKLSRPLGPQLRAQNVLRRVARNPIKRLLRKTAASFVSNFLTYTYKIRDPEKKASVQREVFKALWSGQRAALLAKTNKKSTELIALLDSTDAATLEKALHAISSGQSVPQTAKELGISRFDLTYVLKFLERT